MKIKETTLDHIRSRPRFLIYTDISRETYIAALKIYLKNNQELYSGNTNVEASIISINNGNHAYWKPCLSLRTETDGEKTSIRGVFGPSSSVWTFFMFLYFMLGVLWMVFITLWYVTKQIKSDDFPWALPLSFVCLALLALTYLGAQIGRAKAKTEMKQLRIFAEESLNQVEGTFESSEDLAT